MLDQEKIILNLLGLARKAGKIQAGTEVVKASLKRKNSFLLVMSKDLSDRMKKEFIITSSKIDIKCLEIADRGELGRAVGKNQVTILSVNDAKIAQKIIALYEAM